MQFEPNIWGPHYWFFLHTIAYSYPDTPNEVTKRKYYDLLQNMPLFIPHEKIGNRFSKLLDKYPVTPYLDNKESFIRWVHFIHNKYNHFLGKEEISLELALDNYKAQYKPKPIILTERINLRKHYVHIILILVCLFLIYLYSSDL
jgi:hypothetical protein